MEALKELLDVLLHINDHLDAWTRDYGLWIYVILTAIIFCETGLVVTPFLPGDSLLFAAGAVAARGQLNLAVLLVLLTVAAIVGDSVNYALGKRLGLALFDRFPRVLKREHLERTHKFYEKYGGKTIILARFVPIVRTFAPFVAGLGTMDYGRFLLFNVVGGIAWVVICMGAGYFLGNIEVVKQNFELVVLGIIFVSVLPIVIEWWRHRGAKTA
ncbi:MAG: DedA family protein [Planctomycetes bacterium]|nr:DedA family protein [Planctomycetota bacterium]